MSGMVRHRWKCLVCLLFVTFVPTPLLAEDVAKESPHVVIVVGTRHYAPERTMPVFAEKLREAGLRTTLIVSDGDPEHNKNGKGLPGLEALETADVAVFFMRFLQLPEDQLKHIVDYVKSGKPVVGLRTSSHAFDYPTTHPLARWNNGFGKDVLGTRYFVHLQGSTEISRIEGQESSSLLKGVADCFTDPGTLYKVALPADATVLLLGTGHPKKTGTVTNKFGRHELKAEMTWPVAWTWTNQWGGRVFATTLGHARSFDIESVNRLLINGILWALEAPDKPAAKSQPIQIFQPKNFAGSPVPALRTPLGIPEDYKPWITKLKNNQLLIVCFHAGRKPMKEHAVFWRSDDGGKTWSQREPRPDVAGREFALTCLSDGTLLMPCHFLSNDSLNKAGHTYSKIFRSVDHGKTWTETRIGPEAFPPRAATMNDWTAFEVPDPKRPGKLLTCLGVSMSHGKEQAPDHVSLWRSRDSGKTWDKSLNPDTQSWSDVDGFFCQSVTYHGERNRLLHVVRVDRSGPHWKLPVRPGEALAGNDNADRMMLWISTDAGHTWHKQKDGGRFGIYGEMYPRFLRLADKRLLLTFTVRSGSTDGYPLGVRAIVSEDDGDNWDFRHDRMVISYENQGASGGGFGNTVQNADGSLVSCYSYRGQDGKTHVEAVRWQLPALKK